MFVPAGQQVDVPSLMLGSAVGPATQAEAEQVREATTAEYADMHTWLCAGLSMKVCRYNARMRIDHGLSAYAEVDPMMQSEHISFGDYAADDSPSTPP